MFGLFTDIVLAKVYFNFFGFSS